MLTAVPYHVLMWDDAGRATDIGRRCSEMLAENDLYKPGYVTTIDT